MSADEGFLARWSRRKRDASANQREPATSETAESGAVPAASQAAEETQPLVDLASLPPIDSIDAGSDIRAFLAPGVPADLTRAALRRAWSSDRTIRDFIGLSENSWDFNAPGGVPGFGAVTAEDIRRLLARLTGEPDAAEAARSEAERLSESQAPPAAGGAAPATAGSALDRRQEQRGLGAGPSTSQPLADTNDIAMQHEFAGRECCPPLQRRRHGGALPE
jgi:hypothetical protein